MKWFLFIVFFLLAITCLYSLKLVLAILQQKKMPLRGLLKFTLFERNQFTAREIQSIYFWFGSFVLLVTIPWLYMLFYWLNTDYSFFVALYPLIWVYLVNRVIVFEPSDLIEESSKAKKLRKT